MDQKSYSTNWKKLKMLKSIDFFPVNHLNHSSNETILFYFILLIFFLLSCSSNPWNLFYFSIVLLLFFVWKNQSPFESECEWETETERGAKVSEWERQVWHRIRLNVCVFGCSWEEKWKKCALQTSKVKQYNRMHI